MSTPIFDLLSLPLVPLQRILLSFDHYSFLDFSLCSTTTRDLSRSVVKYRKPVKLEVVLTKVYVWHGNETEPGLRILISKNQRITQLKKEKITNIKERRFGDESFSSLLEDKGVLSTFCSDPFIGTLKIAENIANLYNHPIECVKMEIPKEDRFSITHFYALDKFFSCQTVKKVSFSHHFNIPKSLFVHLMNRLKSVEVLRLGFNNWTSEDDKLTVDLKGSTLKELETDSGGWLTLQNILDGQFERLFVFDTKLTPEDVKTIIENWLGGWNRNMRQMEIQKNSNTRLDVGRLLTGIPAVLKSDEDTRIFENETVEGGWEIKRDTEVCRITTDRIWFCGWRIQFFVWPHSENF